MSHAARVLKIGFVAATAVMLALASSTEARRAASTTPFEPFAPQSQMKFRHSQHANLKCDQCHQRRADAITPLVPGHSSCLGCHVKEFTSKQFGICANCHEGISAVRPVVLPFPERQTYGTEFSHITHATPRSGGQRAECADCHSMAGARATMPGHQQCYTCHKASDELKPGESAAPGSCGTCHTAAGSRKVFRAGGAPYRFRFSHQLHVARGARCNECHDVLRQGGLQVSLPRLAQHSGAGYRSCGSCHNGRRAFTGEIEGGNVNCRKCHGRDMM